LEDPSYFLSLIPKCFNLLLLIQPESILTLAVVVVLLTISAFVSGSEVAFFALTGSDIEILKDEKSKSVDLIVKLLSKPKKLLATILIANNLVNIATIILLTMELRDYLDTIESTLIRFLIEVVGITFILLLIGEVTPKVYANKHKKSLAEFAAFPMYFLFNIFSPVSAALEFMVANIDTKFKTKAKDISVDDLSHVLELTSHSNTTESEKKILKGIVEFGLMEVKEIMKPRMDVVTFEYDTKFTDLINQIVDAGYSRIPVQKEEFDEIVGILYIKDLLNFINQSDDFEWQKLIRPAFFVPESMKLDDLLKEFQDKKIHMAIIVDEYGGSLGIVTFEDIIEEIVGDIKDEFDEEEIIFTKIDDNTFVFEGKTPLNDVYKVLEIEGDDFDEERGDADTLAGFILELAEHIPQKNQKINFKNYVFTIEAADRKRIKKIKVSIKPDKDENENLV